MLLFDHSLYPNTFLMLQGASLIPCSSVTVIEKYPVLSGLIVTAAEKSRDQRTALRDAADAER